MRESGSKIVRRVVAVAITVAALYLLLLFGIPYFKENFRFFQAEALSRLETLNLFQQDYLKAHGTYARSA